MGYLIESENAVRMAAVRKILEEKNLDLALVYYDEFNIGNGWYLTGWCPQFESGAVLVPRKGEPLLLGGPESEPFAKQDSAVKETRNFPVFMVPDEEYPAATIIDFPHLFAELNRNLAQMLKGGVIMDVTTPEQAKIAEDAGACAVMALERIPADIRAAGGVSRMSDPEMIKGIQAAVSIPVMAKCRIGHFAEAQILQAIEIDYIDESEVLSPADDLYHIDKTAFKVPFVCGARDLGEALRRIQEGAAMIRTKGEPGTGDVIQAVRHMRRMNAEIRRIAGLREDELFEAAKELGVAYDLLRYVHENGKLPVVNFAAGGIATPADASLMMQLGAEGVFVGSGIFKSGDPAKRANAIVKAVTNYQDAAMIAELSSGLGEAMVGINADEIKLIMEERGK